MAFFVVTSEQGPAWVPTRAMREQPLWTEHAEFINGLARVGRIALGGPLRGEPVHRALLIVQSPSLEEVHEWFRSDPWVRAGILRITRAEPWEILVSDDRLDPALAEITRR